MDRECADVFEVPVARHRSVTCERDLTSAETFSQRARANYRRTKGESEDCVPILCKRAPWRIATQRSKARESLVES